MNWNTHFSLKGTHAFLSPSQSSWVNDSDERLRERYTNHQAIKRGTELHSFAEIAIKHGIRQPESDITLYKYINDGIDFRMDPEVVLYGSKWCYGTADTISFRIEPDISRDLPTLRIHDLKTGKHPAKLMQLEVYAALFCLEYQYRPDEMAMILRIYQNDDIFELMPTAEDIVPIMDKIMRFTEIIESIEGGA